MKWIQYQVLQCVVGQATILVDKKVGYSEANLAIAEKEAHDGYVITEDGESFEKEPLSIELGGTGGKTKADARKSLEVLYAVEDTSYSGCYYRPIGSSKERINPPMVLGVEYRTSERHNGNVVWMKLINGGAMPNNSSKTINAGLTPSKVVSIEAMVTDGTYSLKLPYIFATGEIRAIVYNKNGNITLTTLADLSTYTATILVKYIK